MDGLGTRSDERACIQLAARMAMLRASPERDAGGRPTGPVPCRKPRTVGGSNGWLPALTPVNAGPYTLLRPGPGRCCADVAQLAEQLFCKQQVAGSSPIVGSADIRWKTVRTGRCLSG